MTVTILDQAGNVLGECAGASPGGVCPRAGDGETIFCAGHQLDTSCAAGSGPLQWAVAADARTCPLWAAGR
jgi:hypothetical protein